MFASPQETIVFVGRFQKNKQALETFCRKQGAKVSTTTTSRTTFVVLPSDLKVFSKTKLKTMQLNKLTALTRVVRADWVEECRRQKTRVAHGPYKVPEKILKPFTTSLHLQVNSEEPFYVDVVSGDVQCLTEFTSRKNPFCYNWLSGTSSYNYPRDYRERLLGEASIADWSGFSKEARMESCRRVLERVRKDRERVRLYREELQRRLFTNKVNSIT